MEAFSELIGNRRKELGLSMRAVSKLLIDKEGINCSKSLVNFLEKGVRVPTYDIAYALSKVLGIEAEVVLEAAYKARIGYDQSREIKKLSEFIAGKGPNKLDPDKIITQ